MSQQCVPWRHQTMDWKAQERGLCNGLRKENLSIEPDRWIGTPQGMGMWGL